MISVKIDGRGLEELKKCLPEAVRLASRDAMNAASTSVKKEWADAIAKQIALPVSTIKNAIDIRVEDTQLSATVDSQLSNDFKTTFNVRALPVSLFHPIQNKLGTSVKIKKKTGRVMIKHAFIARLGSQQNVFIRKTKKRFPLKTVTTTAVEEVAMNTLPAMKDLMNDKFSKSLTRSLIYRLNSCQQK